MPLISLIITLAVVGVILWLINAYIPMDPTINRIINVVVIIAVVLWLLSALGVFTGMGTLRVGASPLVTPIFCT